MFQCVGERLNTFIRFILKRKLKHSNANINHLIIFEVILTLVIILSASLIFMKFEGWSYFYAFYYCVITLTTIGKYNDRFVKILLL